MSHKQKKLGWVKLHREQWDHWVSTKKPYSYGYAWTYLYSKANHKDKEVLVNNILVHIKRGQHLTSLLKLKEAWGWKTPKKVSNFLNKLEDAEMIEQERTSHYTLITIKNYEHFQRKGGGGKNKGKTEAKPRHTNKNDKECKRNPFLEA